MNEYFKKFSEDNYYASEDIRYRLKKSDNLDDVFNEIVKLRKTNGHKTIFKSQNDSDFFYYIRKFMFENIEFLEKNSKMNLAESGDHAKIRKMLYESLLDEAMSSSAIEGAFSTRKRTEELVSGKSNPKNKDEKMILNNFHALQFINSNNKDLITHDFILQLHDIITKDTLEKEDITKRYRDDYVGVNSSDGTIIYKAPKASDVEKLMEKLIVYINSDTNENVFIKASIIQFMFLYIHPFFDGNGRTARALSYMYLIQSGYDFFRFFSISYVVKEYKSDYYKSILQCEDGFNDLTYFIDFNIKMIAEAVKTTLEIYNNEYLKLAVAKYIQSYRIHLTSVQSKLLDKYYKMKDKQLTVKKYVKLTDLTISTAQKHLQHFVKIGIFKKIKQGDNNIYFLNDLSFFIEANKKSS